MGSGTTGARRQGAYIGSMDGSGQGAARDEVIKLFSSQEVGPAQELAVQFLPGAQLSFSTRLLADDPDMRVAEGRWTSLFDDNDEPLRVLTIRATKRGPVGTVKITLTSGELDLLLECLEQAKRRW